MKINPPIDLTVTTMTVKVSCGAQERLRKIAKDNNLNIQDVVSVCLLHMPEREIVRIAEQQKAALEQLSPEARAMLRKMNKLSEGERALLRGILASGE